MTDANDDRCAWRHCRRESVIIVCGRGLCELHHTETFESAFGELGERRATVEDVLKKNCPRRRVAAG
jgi:hypothetical protein